MAFYYTEICNLHMKNYMKLFKIRIPCRKKPPPINVNFEKTLNCVIHAM